MSRLLHPLSLAFIKCSINIYSKHLIGDCRYARFILLKSNVKRCFLPTTPSVYHINEVVCASANLTIAHDRETSCLPSKEQQGWKSGRENQNKSECAGLLIERSALFVSALASVLPMTFDYCGVKRASTECDLCIISLQPCVWISRHTRASLLACAG